MTKPTVQVSLTTSGGLELILQDGRAIPLRNGEVQVTLERVLEGMLRTQTHIGLDGSPTRTQALHWQQHSIFPNDKCAFCRAETLGKVADSIDGGKARARLRESVLSAGRTDGVQIKYVAPKGGRTASTKQSKELGL